jgi:hypothetical protein
VLFLSDAGLCELGITDTFEFEVLNLRLTPFCVRPNDFTPLKLSKSVDPALSQVWIAQLKPAVVKNLPARAQHQSDLVYKVRVPKQIDPRLQDFYR